MLKVPKVGMILTHSIQLNVIGRTLITIIGPNNQGKSPKEGE